jgi:quercetin dioxygenase-like cupin family protein
MASGCSAVGAEDSSGSGPSERVANANDSRQAFAIPGDEGPAVWFLGSLASVKSTVEESGAQWGAIVVSAAPGYSPAPHIHHREDESFYLLEGQLSFTAGSQTFDVVPGTFVFAPMGVDHHFIVTSDAQAKWLLIHGPTGDFHRFINEVGGPASEPHWPPRSAPPDPGKVREIALKHHIEPLAPSSGTTSADD